MKTVEELQDSLYNAAKKRDTKFNILKDKLLRMDILEEAWKRVKEDRGIEENGVQSFLEKIREELRNKTYRTGFMKRVFIPKDNRKFRPLGIPTLEIVWFNRQ